MSSLSSISEARMLLRDWQKTEKCCLWLSCVESDASDVICNTASMKVNLTSSSNLIKTILRRRYVTSKPSIPRSLTTLCRCCGLGKLASFPLECLPPQQAEMQRGMMISLALKVHLETAQRTIMNWIEWTCSGHFSQRRALLRNLNMVSINRFFCVTDCSVKTTLHSSEILRRQQKVIWYLVTRVHHLYFQMAVPKGLNMPIL